MIETRKLTRDTQADPLLLARSTGSVDSRSDLLVALVQVVDNLLAFLLDLCDRGLLLDNQRVHILEQLRQLDHLLLDLDQSIVTILHGAQSGTSTTLTIAMHKRLLEYLSV